MPCWETGPDGVAPPEEPSRPPRRPPPEEDGEDGGVSPWTVGAGELPDGLFCDDGFLLPEPPEPPEDDPPPDCDFEGAGDGDGEEDGSRLGNWMLGSFGSDGDDPDLEGDGELVGSSFGTVPVTPFTTPLTVEPRLGVVDALAGAGASSETATVTTAVPVTSGTARATVDFQSPVCFADRA
ncbi:MAG: hypothetical protein J2P46_22095 [Zavarzinella sp.]|nr:hypothetical protein [Zavarzinella sp.]